MVIMALASLVICTQRMSAMDPIIMHCDANLDMWLWWCWIWWNYYLLIMEYINGWVWILIWKFPFWCDAEMATTKYWYECNIYVIDTSLGFKRMSVAQIHPDAIHTRSRTHAHTSHSRRHQINSRQVVKVTSARTIDFFLIWTFL